MKSGDASDEPLLSGEEERYGTEDERDTEKPLVSITMTGRCSICLLCQYRRWWFTIRGG